MSGRIVMSSIASAAMLWLLAFRIRKAFGSDGLIRSRVVIFFLVVFLLILALRWPGIRYKSTFNPDEGQLLAQAMRYVSHPVPWRDVDGTTSGPLNSILLSSVLYFGAPATWQTARLVAWGAICLILLLLYLTLLPFGKATEAQLALMPAIFYYAFASNNDFTFYSSETLPVLLVSGCLCCLAWEWSADRPSNRRLFLLGLAAGAMPFAKLQTAPLAGFLITLGFALLIVRYCRRESPRLSLLAGSGALCLGAVLIPGLILGVVTASGAFGDFLKSYVLASGSYVKEPLSVRLHALLRLFATPSSISPLLLATVAATILRAGPVPRGARPQERQFWPVTVISLLGVLAVFCFFVAGKSFLHYLNLLLPACAIFVGLGFFQGKATWDALRAKAASPSPFAVRFLTCCGLLVALQVAQAARYLIHVGKGHWAQTVEYPSAVSRAVLAVRQPGDTLSVWGWMPEYYVETGLPPTTRDAICHYVISPGRLRGYFQKRHLADLQRARPSIFIDAVASGTFVFDWTNNPTHETFPDLARFIDSNYTLFRSIQLEAGGQPVRIYLQNQRLVKPAGNPPADLASPLQSQ